jgi:hypothetical protein
MGKHWVQAQTPFSRYDENGVLKRYNPGDWLEVRNQELLELEAQRKVLTTASILKQTFDFSDCGVLWRTIAQPPALIGLQEYGIPVVIDAAPRLLWKYTAIAAAGSALTAQNIALGFARIEDGQGFETWEIAAQLAEGLPLAERHGTAEERASTLAVVGDLRIPLYDVTLMWVRATAVTRELIAAWGAELATGADERHAFARALYTRRVHLCTLPPRWIGASPGLR